MKKLSFLLCRPWSLHLFYLQKTSPKRLISIEVIIGNRPPAPNEAQLMRAEESSHPNIAGNA